MSQQKIPCIFYLYLHLRFFEKSKGKPMKVNEAKKYMFRWGIPSKLRPLIIKEMEILGLLERRRFWLDFEYPKINPNDCNGFYKELGIY